MKLTRRLFAAVALAGLCGGCGEPVFESVGVDLHQPSLQLLAIAYQPVEVDGETPPPVLLPPSGFVVRVNDKAASKILLQISYADAGADIVNFTIRDRQSSLSDIKSPSAPQVDIDGDGDLDTLETPEFFVGTVGIAQLENIELKSTLGGIHELELWAEDSHGSRSDKIVIPIEFQH